MESFGKVKTEKGRDILVYKREPQIVGFTKLSGVTAFLKTMLISFLPVGSPSCTYSSSLRMLEVRMDPCASDSVATCRSINKRGEVKRGESRGGKREEGGLLGWFFLVACLRGPWL